jgi:murein DD-endopeptidase MepM/ murein hydrolase activator NlpD
MARFELFYPVKPFVITQQFGVNGEYYRSHGIEVQGHPGHDLRAGHGQPVRAAHDGVVVYAGMDVNEGIGVVIRTAEPRDYEGTRAYFKSIYWHLINNIPVRVGQKVKVGDTIGYADNTGLSNGDHLHFSVKPQAKGENDWEWLNTKQTNGYLGNIDPQQFYNGVHAEDAQSFLRMLTELIALLTMRLTKR